MLFSHYRKAFYIKNISKYLISKIKEAKTWISDGYLHCDVNFQ